MGIPRITALLLTATCLMSGCCSLTGHVATDGIGASQKVGLVPKGAAVQKGHVHQKGETCQTCSHQGAIYPQVAHQNLWNKYVPSGCCDYWDPVLGSCGGCGVCGGTCEGHTPAQHLKHKLTCVSGASELYWGDWISHPPEPCDPCDDWGNWTGPNGCCKPSCWDKLASCWHGLFGYHKGGGGKGGCTSCGGKGGCSDCGGDADPVYYDGVPVEQERLEEVPTPEIDDSQPAAIRPRSNGGFSIRSTRFAR